MARFAVALVLCLSVSGVACGKPGAMLTAPSSGAVSSVPSSASTSAVRNTNAEEPPFNLEAILRGDGFGLVEFRQAKNSSGNIINLDVSVRDLAPNSSYSLQRAVDTVLDGECTGTNWLTLGQGATPYAIETDERGTGRASLWRDLSALAPGTAFDIHFRVVQTGTTDVALESGCYRFVVRD
jgi:hypothetical protein